MIKFNFSKSRFREIWAISYPVIIGTAIENVISFTDTAFMGRVSETALAAAAVGSLYYMLLTMMGMGFGMGTQVLIAKRFGENNTEELRKTFQQAVFFLTFSALLFFMLSFAFSSWIITHVLNSEGVSLLANDFIRIRTYAIGFSYANILFRAYFIGTANTKTIAYVSLFSATLNVFLCYIFVFGKFGIEPMGIKGAALASLIAEGAGTLLYIYRVQSAKLNVGLLKQMRIHLTTMRELLIIALPTMLQFFISFTAWFSFFLIIEKLGQQELAVSNISRTVYLTVLLPLWGFGAATSSLVSIAIGEGKPQDIKSIIMHSLPLSFLCLFSLSLASYFFRENIANIFTTDQNVSLSFQSTSLPIALGATLMSISIILFNGIIGRGKTIHALIIETSCLVVYLAYTWFQVYHGSATLATIWYSEVVYSIFLGTISIFTLQRLGKQS